MRRSPNAIAFLVAGVYLAIGGITGFVTVNAAVLLFLGANRYRYDRSRLSVLLIAVSTLVLVINQFALLAVIVLASLAVYYWKSKPSTTAIGTYVNKYQLFLNMRKEEQSWLLHSMSFWHAVGEVRLDLSLAMPENKETAIVLQGLVGDVDLVVPEDYGLEVEASVLLGQISFRQTKEGGMFHRLSWKSPNYDECEQRVKLRLFYLVGDIKIITI
jgi:lia operon protein LiaF